MTSMNRPIRQSRRKIATAEITMDSKVIANWLMPLSKKLRTVSISLVKREMTLPEVYRSWNETLSDCA